MSMDVNEKDWKLFRKNLPDWQENYIIVAVAAVLSLYFYLQYYKVKPMTGYFFGMVPLITEAISMGVFEFLTR